jgi:NAD(P)-dependent dehydrogenase (short-subunit alcohol dehydrogenase family)
LVTGPTDGIGVAIAHTIAVEGAQVIVSGRNAERGEQVVQSILAAGPVAILVNDAAMLLAPQPTGGVPEDVIDQALATNIKAVLLLTGLLAPAMADPAPARSSTSDQSTASSGWRTPRFTAQRPRSTSASQRPAVTRATCPAGC